MAATKLTPMLRQYLAIKQAHPDTILFYRMGDFYEMFFEDAVTAAPILEVVLTSRDKNKENSVPMCGIPYHARDNYVGKLLKKGYKVAVCEQMEEAAAVKGIVKREVTQILTPATALEIDGLDNGINSYLLVLHRLEGHIGLAAVDLAAGEFEVRHFPPEDQEALQGELYRKLPRELIISADDSSFWRQLTRKIPELAEVLVSEKPDHEFNLVSTTRAIMEHFQVQTLAGFGIEEYPAAIMAAGVMLRHLLDVRRSTLKSISRLRFQPRHNHLLIDPASFRNLEILQNQRTASPQGSLFAAVDQTLTPMGRRLLKHWLSYPLIDKAAIESRHEGVAELQAQLVRRSEIRRLLRNLPDLARLTARIGLQVAGPLHLLQLRQALLVIPELQEAALELKAPITRESTGGMDPIPELVELIGSAVSEAPPANPAEGGYIRSGFNRELDELRSISRNAKEVVSAMEKRERENSGIPSLKIRYNRVFGYYLEVTRPHLKLVPAHYIRKQTLVNAERFLTPELQELEERILRAEEQSLEIEKQILGEIILRVQAESSRLNLNSDLIARLDLLCAAAELAQRQRQVRPEICEDRVLKIEAGRHPVIEAASEHPFIPNDLEMNADGQQIIVLTGPNMGGKSTYLRQNALIVLLAQAGFFVPAEKALIGICDRIFTRIGASDALIEGKSTFFVEMIETAVIINNLSRRSLILLDEIGRGTSTFDGLSIAWSVIEHLHSLDERPLTLFATHYHELLELAEVLDRVRNFHIAVREWQEKIIFLHKVMPGGTDQSFGIHVARIAGLPAGLIDRAKEILLGLEKKELNRLVRERLTGRLALAPEKQKKLFPEDQELRLWDEIRNQLAGLDTDSLTPLAALNLLHALKKKTEAMK